MPVRHRHLPTPRRAERGDVVQQAILSVGRQECQQALGEPGTGWLGSKPAWRNGVGQSRLRSTGTTRGQLLQWHPDQQVSSSVCARVKT